MANPELLGNRIEDKGQLHIIHRWYRGFHSKSDFDPEPDSAKCVMGITGKETHTETTGVPAVGTYTVQPKK